MSAKKTTSDQTPTAVTDPIKDLADVLAIEVIRAELPGLVRARVRELLTSNTPEDRAKLQEVLQQIGFVIAAEALSDCLKAAVSASQKQLRSFFMKPLDTRYGLQLLPSFFDQLKPSFLRQL